MSDGDSIKSALKARRLAEAAAEIDRDVAADMAEIERLAVLAAKYNLRVVSSKDGLIWLEPTGLQTSFHPNNLVVAQSASNHVLRFGVGGSNEILRTPVQLHPTGERKCKSGLFVKTQSPILVGQDN
jgi:hypothetical protein